MNSLIALVISLLLLLPLHSSFQITPPNSLYPSSLCPSSSSFLHSRRPASTNTISLITTNPDHLPLLTKLNTAAGSPASIISTTSSPSVPISIFINIKPGPSETNYSAAELTAIETTNYEVAFYEHELNSHELDSHVFLLHRLIAHALSVPRPSHLTYGLNTFFTSLTAPRISDLALHLPEIANSSDALEFRVDLLADPNDRFTTLREQQTLRLLSRDSPRAPAVITATPYDGTGPGSMQSTILTSSLPIVYTVRTANQAGTYPDSPASIAKMFEILHLGLRAGVEILDVEAAWGEEHWAPLLRVNRLVYNKKTSILGSHHVPDRMINDTEASALAIMTSLDGQADAVKLILSADTPDTASQALDVCTKALRGRNMTMPVIAMALGLPGQHSRVLNPRFTPVTHPALPFVAAPGQLCAKDLIAKRVQANLLPPRTYHILGKNIPYTLSPALHERALEVAALPHTYVKNDVDDMSSFIDSPAFKAATFGGSSVTIPYKIEIMEHLDVIDDAASKVGAVNTIVAEYDEKGGRVLKGYNTDVDGIYNPIKRRLVPGEDTAASYFLIIGAGGAARAAAYAATKLKFKLLIWNRTKEKAVELQRLTGGEVVDDLDSLGSDVIGRLRVVMSTLPAAAEFKLPQKFLTPELICFDANYKPYSTEFLKQGEEEGCKVIRGSEMFYEQGVKQFEFWTGRTAPFGVMQQLVLDKCLE